MEGGYRLFFIAFFLLIVAGAIGGVLIYRYVSLSPSGLEECKTVRHAGEDKINIVFFASNRSASKYAVYFYSISPFNRYRDNFNFYFIDDYKPTCETYKGVGLYCYSRELVRKAASCPNDYIIVVDEAAGDLRSSAYMNVISINSGHPLSVLHHEFGHVFAALSDEYVPAEVPRKAKNCVDDCAKFGEDKDGCFAGCGSNELFRSIENGLMRTLDANSYGKFDEKIIVEKVAESVSVLTGSAIEEGRDCSKEKYLLVEGNYSNGNIVIISKKIQIGCIGENGVGMFNYSIFMQDNSVKKEGEFNPELVFVDAVGANNETVGGAYRQEGLFWLRIPIIENAKSLVISDSDGKKINELGLWDVGARPCRV